MKRMHSIAGLTAPKPIDVINASFFSVVISDPWDGGGTSTG
jgi:hypothetical protein